MNVNSDNIFFLLLESQKNVSTKVIRFCVSLTVTGHDRVSDSDCLQQQSKISHLSMTFCTSEPYVDFVFIKDYFMTE